MSAPCAHSCKGLCAALEAADHREAEAIKEYRRYAGECDYPDIRRILEELAEEHEKALTHLREQREILAVRFAVLDRINESFA